MIELRELSRLEFPALLAFSYGVDSTALFWLLVEKNIPFDLAFINYNTRKESQQEMNEATDLAAKFHKKIYIKELYMSLNESNFEMRAREVRHKFFAQICKENGYKSLLFAHQLNDLFEWFLMRFSKGSGLWNLIGMQPYEKKELFSIFRPLLFTPKDELIDYLDKNRLKYFIDSSNLDTKYQRNFIRQSFSDKFIKLYKDGVVDSFEFLNSDLSALLEKPLFEKGPFAILQNSQNSINLIDKLLKKQQVVMSQKQRIWAKKDGVISGKVAIGYKDELIFIAPFVKTAMPKEFREFCRFKKIPPLIRPYLCENRELLEAISHFL